MTDQMDDYKAKKKKYGKTMKPIPCTRAFKKPMAFDHTNMTTESFILVNDNTQTRTHVNLYSGEAGVGYDAERSTHALGDAKTQKKKLKDYKECDISECPVALAIPVQPQSQPAQPAQPAQSQPQTQPAQPQGAAAPSTGAPTAQAPGNGSDPGSAQPQAAQASQISHDEDEAPAGA